ncbi:MAG: hypothetical protein QXF35_03385 [Candidatus Bilamarchaeaceae archaeon]
MKLKILFALVLAFLIFGCISEQQNYEMKKNILANKNEYDIDGDGIWDYAIYDFQKVKIGDKNTLHRTVAVVNLQSATYKKFNNLTDMYVQKVDLDIGDAVIEKKQDYDACVNKLGLSSGRCITPSTCVNLCALKSDRCRMISSTYNEILGESIIDYQKKIDDVDNSITNARTILPQLVRDEKNERKNVYLDYIFEAKNAIAEINTNPLFVEKYTKLCEQGNYGAERIISAAKKIGNYEVETKYYKYKVYIEVEGEGQEYYEQAVSMSVEDRIPFQVETDLVTSPQTISRLIENEKTNIKWSSASIATKTYVFTYSFQTEKTPEEYINNVVIPKTKITYANLALIAAINSIFLVFSDITSSHYFAAGLALGLTLAIFMLTYTLLSLAFIGVRGALSGKKFLDEVVSKLSKTPIRWKFSIPAALIMFVVAFILNNYLVPEPVIIKNIVDITQFDFDNPNAMFIHLSGMIIAIAAVIMLYDGLENLLKVSILDKYYGATRRARRQDYIGQVVQLKERIAELKDIIQKAAATGVDVSKEQEVLASISPQRISLLERKMSPENAIILAENLDKVEAAIATVKEKTNAVEENWPKWREQIEKELIERNEVSSNMLLFIKPELRGWALARYASEHSSDEIIFEKDVLKRKKITASMLLREMANKKMLNGGILIKNENIVASYIEGEKSATVSSVLLLRLRSYIYSLNKAMGTGAPESFISVGNKTVFLITKISGYDCALFIPKERLKESYELFKEKIKTISE